MSRLTQIERTLRKRAISAGRVPPELSMFYQPRSFFSWHRRPREVETLFSLPSPSEVPNVGLVVQGPIVHRFHFTINSLRYYRKLLPSSQIVLSTWRGADSRIRSELNSLEVELVENETPTTPGIGNINFQIRSTHAGLRRLDQSNVSVAFKLRTDQRIYNPYSFSLMARMLQEFRKEDGSFRIGTVSLDTFSSRPYSLSDMVQFSDLKSLGEFWNLDEVRDGLEEEIGSVATFPEEYLVKKYLVSIGLPLGDPMETWKMALSSLFLVVDSDSIDLFWQKYSRREHLWRRYRPKDLLQEVSFAEWLTLAQMK